MTLRDICAPGLEAVGDEIETQSLLDAEPLPERGAPRPDHAYLLVIERGATRVVSLPRDGELLIGRGARAHLVLRDAAVSRIHARIIVERGELRICDLGSHNGTHVDGERINAGSPLATGSVITICSAKLVVHAAAVAIGSSKQLDIGPSAAIVADPAVENVYALLEKLAFSDLPVLVHGETGCGKELAANALHHWSKRRTRPLVALNCAALPESLFESELFGHDQGAFSGATTSRAGLFELASGGTLLLDEVGELPLAIQPKLLRVLETKKVARLGELAREREIDVRIVAMTNRDLKREVKQGRFREDLYYRLGAATVWVPPLRDRPGDLPVLARAFLEQASRKLLRDPPAISDQAMQAILQYRWPGNVRELKNIMEYSAATAGPVLEYSDLSGHFSGESAADAASPEVAGELPGPRSFRPIQEEIEEIEKARMAAALQETGGHQRRAAELIAMPLRTFVAKLEKYRLRGDRRLAH